MRLEVGTPGRAAAPPQITLWQRGAVPVRWKTPPGAAAPALGVPVPSARLRWNEINVWPCVRSQESRAQKGASMAV